MYLKAYLASRKAYREKKKRIFESAKAKFIEANNGRPSLDTTRCFQSSLLVRAISRKWICLANYMLISDRKWHVSRGDETDLSQTPMYHALRLDYNCLSKRILRRSLSLKDFKYLKLLVDRKSRLNHCTLLQIAVARNNLELIRVLVILDAIMPGERMLATKDANGWTPLHYVWYIWSQPEDRQSVDKALDILLSGVDDSVPNVVNNEGLSHLHVASCKSNANAVRAILRSGDVNINAKCEKSTRGSTPLFYAVKYNRREVVKVLLDHGANPTMPCDQFRTPLFEAARFGYHKCYEIFLEAARTGLENPLVWEQNVKDQLEIITMLARHGGKLGIKSSNWKSMLSLCWHDNCDTLAIRSRRRILNDYWRCTCNIYIEGCPEEPLNDLMERIYKHDWNCWRERVLMKLLECKVVDINAKDEEGKTVMHFLIEDKLHNGLFLAKKLIKHGAALEIRTAEGLTPLQNAVDKCQVDMVHILLRAKVSKNTVVLPRGFTPLHTACIKHNWDSMAYQKIAHLLMLSGFELNARDNHGNSPLYYTLLCGVPAPMLLLEAGADVNNINNIGESVLRKPYEIATKLIIERPHEEQFKNLDEYKLIKRHIHKLQALGIPISKRLLEDCQSFDNLYPFIGSFHHEYTPEVERLKAIHLCPYMSLQTILLKPTNEVFRYADNELFISLGKTLRMERMALPVMKHLLKTRLRDYVENGGNENCMVNIFLSLEDLLLKDASEIFLNECKYGMNVQEKLKGSGSIFPDYGYLLYVKFKECRERLQLVKATEQRLVSICENHDYIPTLPVLCLLNIIKMLTNAELSKLLRTDSNKQKVRKFRQRGYNRKRSRQNRKNVAENQS